MARLQDDKAPNLATIVFSFGLDFFSFMLNLLLILVAISYFLLHLSFPLVWLFSPSRDHVADTCCYSLFIPIISLHNRLESYTFIQKDLGHCGLNTIY